MRLDHAIEVVAFGDEEGVRFSDRDDRLARARRARCSATRAGRAGRATASRSREALTAFGGDPERAYALRARDIAAFVELHIEQGPVLEAEGLALGVVGAINGATRMLVTVQRGSRAMPAACRWSLRRDAVAAAAEMILAIEARARAEPDLVATVGRLEVEPGAVNVIPGLARFSLDMRSPARRMAPPRRQRHPRRAAWRSPRGATSRRCSLPVHEAPAYVCDRRHRRRASTARWRRWASRRSICLPAPATTRW